MPMSLAALLDPRHSAVVSMEMQRGVIGDLSSLPDLANAASERGIIPNATRIITAARAAGAAVVHCVAHHDGSSPRNAPLLRAMAKGSQELGEGSEEAALVPEIGPEASDIISARKHGLTPFPGTDLDSVLRNRDTTTVVAIGVSLNVGIAGLVMVAVDLGYEVVVATDAVVGIPVEYGDAVLANTIPALATRATTDEIVAVWAP